MRLYLKLLALVMVVSVGLILYLSIIYNDFVDTPPDDKHEIRVVDIKYGTSAAAVFNELARAGVITSAKKFRYFSKLQGKIEKIKYGEYEFTTSMKPRGVLDMLVTGAVKKYKVTIPEGYNLYQVADTVSNVLKGIDKEAFIEKALDPEYAKSLGLDAPSLEGYLFPDTYHFTKDFKLDGILKKMVKNFRRVITERSEQRAKELGMSMHEIMTLASIIEKETAAKSEMPLISAVFHSRMKKKMRLQSDPTVIYGIADFNGNLTRKDLETTTPYNTYRVGGLPPTPIANPGLQAIEAALFPDDVDYLYFVSKNNGEHFFSVNFEDHQKAVYKYQIRREKP